MEEIKFAQIYVARSDNAIILGLRAVLEQIHSRFASTTAKAKQTGIVIKNQNVLDKQLEYTH